MNTDIFTLDILVQPFLNQGEKFESAYALWNELWSESYKEMKKPDLTVSDTFTRQHEILVLSVENKVIASVCHRYVSLISEATFADSYFKDSWSQIEINRLKKIGGIGVLGSQISVAKGYRREEAKIDIKRLISFLSLRHLQNKGVDVILGMMRLDRGMGKVFYEAGAEALALNRPYFGTSVDLVALFPKKNPVVIPDSFQFLVERLLSLQNQKPQSQSSNFYENNEIQKLNQLGRYYGN